MKAGKFAVDHSIAQAKTSLKVAKKVIKILTIGKKIGEKNFSFATFYGNRIETHCRVKNVTKKNPERLIFHAHSLLTRQEAPSGFCGLFSGRWLWDFLLSFPIR